MGACIMSLQLRQKKDITVVLTFLRKGQSEEMHMVNIKLFVNATK